MTLRSSVSSSRFFELQTGGRDGETGAEGVAGGIVTVIVIVVAQQLDGVAGFHRQIALGLRLGLAVIVQRICTGDNRVLSLFESFSNKSLRLP